jgi:hypothetical protein
VNLCDSCKKWDKCGLRDHGPRDTCVYADLVTRADLAARDAKISQLSEARRVVPELTQADYDSVLNGANLQGRSEAFRFGWAGGMHEGFKLAVSRLQSIPAARVLKDGEKCPECGSTNLQWGISHATRSSAPDGRLRMSEVSTVAFLGCGACSETVRTLDEQGIIDTLRAAQAKGVEG